MSKMTYRDQLLHPSWQRRRLEVLSRDRFSCTECEATDKTLHVHHKRYVKGRMAWEYEDGDLTTLCKDCHESGHEVKKLIEREIALRESCDMAGIHAFLVGVRGGQVESEGCPKAYADTVLMPGDEASKSYWIGSLAGMLSETLNADEAVALFMAAVTLGKGGLGMAEIVFAASTAHSERASGGVKND